MTYFRYSNMQLSLSIDEKYWSLICRLRDKRIGFEISDLGRVASKHNPTDCYTKATDCRQLREKMLHSRINDPVRSGTSVMASISSKSIKGNLPLWRTQTIVRHFPFATIQSLKWIFYSRNQRATMSQLWTRSLHKHSETPPTSRCFLPKL